MLRAKRILTFSYNIISLVEITYYITDDDGRENINMFTLRTLVENLILLPPFGAVGSCGYGKKEKKIKTNIMNCKKVNFSICTT